MSSVKSESLTSFWSIWMPFIPLCCLIAEAKTSNTMSNNSGESGHPCLVPDLRGKALRFFPFEDDINIGSFIYDFYDLEVWSFYPYFLEGFYQERMLYFVTCFFCIYWEDCMVLVLSVDVMNHIECFADMPVFNLRSTLSFREKMLLIMMNSNLSNVPFMD